MEVNRLDTILRSAERLPTLPTIYTRLNQLLQSPTSTVRMISAVIAEDQSIAVKVLKLVNSAFYGLPQKIGNLKHAIVILGLGQIKNLVLATSTLRMFQGMKVASSFDMQKFWEHSIGCAVAARVIAETAYLKSPDDVFTGGLLHDIGKLIHAVYLHEAFAEVLAEVSEQGTALIESERKILGYDHAYTGSELARRWNFSKHTIEMIAHHHLSNPSRVVSKEVAAVHLGNIFTLALELGSGGDRKVPCAREEAWEILGIELHCLESMLLRIKKLFAESVAILRAEEN